MKLYLPEFYYESLYCTMLVLNAICLIKCLNALNILLNILMLN